MPRKSKQQAYIERVLGDTQEIKCSKPYFYSKEPRITIEVHGKDLTFELLQKLSKALQTKLINIHPEYAGPGCSSCGFGSETWVELEVRNPHFPSG